MRQGVAFGHVAVNASAADIVAQDFAEGLLGRIAAASIAPKHVQLEVTETVFLGRGAEGVEASLRRLSAAGIRIALDGFGTGYASLTHLKRFPVDVPKIDRSFVSSLETNPDDAAIVRAVATLARSLGLSVVAEGIETEAQAAFLREQGCQIGQGFLFGKAVAACDVEAIVTAAPRPEGKPRLMWKA